MYALAEPSQEIASQPLNKKQPTLLAISKHDSLPG
jgi:hypothetical protein